MVRTVVPGEITSQGFIVYGRTTYQEIHLVFMITICYCDYFILNNLSIPSIEKLQKESCHQSFSTNSTCD
jgi:hypothetical protein